MLLILNYIKFPKQYFLILFNFVNLPFAGYRKTNLKNKQNAHREGIEGNKNMNIHQSNKALSIIHRVYMKRLWYK